MRAVAFALAVSTSLFYTAQAQADWKAVRDFSAINPVGTWSYGYGLTGSEFTRYNKLSVPCTFGPPPLALRGIDCWLPAVSPDNKVVGVNVKGRVFRGEQGFVVPTDALYLHPGLTGKHTIVRWTSPSDGTYEIKGFFEILDDTPTGVAPKIFLGTSNITTDAFGGDSGELTGPGADLATLKPGQRKDFSMTRFLKEGRVISFGVDPGFTSDYDSTGFNAVITKVGP